MILQALNEQYQRLLDDPESGVAPPGYCPAKVSHAAILSVSGELIDILPISIQNGKKVLPRILLVPEQIKRAAGIDANYLCDNASYVFGLERDKQGTATYNQRKFDDFSNKNISLLQNLKCIEAKTVIRFLSQWDENQIGNNSVLNKLIDEIMDGSNIVFKLDGQNGYIHEQEEIRKAWDNHNDEDTPVIRQCLVTGETGKVSRLHPSIKNIVGAQPSGASLVSFNFDSLISYSPGKRYNEVQSYNSPVSIAAAAAYGKALNYLLSSNTNHIRLADTTMVFWADKIGSKTEELALTWSLDPIFEVQNDSEGNRRIDPVSARQAKTIFERVKSGLPVEDSSFDPKTRCFMLGLAPNAARLSVRFWQVSNFGDVLDKIAQHYRGMDIVGMERLGGIVSPWRTLKVLAVLEDSKNISPLLGGQFLKAILSGQMYPQSLYNSALIRCRAGGEHGGVTTIRAGIIKAFLLRKFRIHNQIEKEALITVSLNESNTNTAYLLGRLFSLLEKVQRDALGKDINATIRDRYFGAASATPGSVFPLLLRLSRHHISKSDYGDLSDRKIQDVLAKLDSFPAHLNLEEQGLFILGYYHQNEANYVKNQKHEEKEG